MRIDYMDKKYAKVIIDNRAHNTDKPYTYLIKPEMVDIIQKKKQVYYKHSLIRVLYN